MRALNDAGPRDISFLSNPRYRKYLENTAAGALLVADAKDLGGRDGVVVTARACDSAGGLVSPDPVARARVSPLAALSAEIAESACLEPFVYVGEGARIGPGCWIQQGAVIGPSARVGEGCRIMPNAVVMDNCILGDRVWLNPGAIVGGQGFGFVEEKGTLRKVPQTSMVEIGDDVEIGANLASTVEPWEHHCSRASWTTWFRSGMAPKSGREASWWRIPVAEAVVSVSTRAAQAACWAISRWKREGCRPRMVSKDIQEDAVVSGVPAQDHRAGGTSLVEEARANGGKDSCPSLRSVSGFCPPRHFHHLQA